MATNKDESNTEASARVRAYVRRLLGLSGQSSGQRGTSSTKLPLPKSYSAGRISETPRTLSRQLEAMAYTSTSKRASNSSGSGAGNAWLIAPLAGTVKSLFSLFSGDTSSSQSTRYRSRSRAPFQIVESISPESGNGTQSLNESAAALTGVTSGFQSSGSEAAGSVARAGGIGTSRSDSANSPMNNRLALVTALRRGLSESRGIADVLSEFQDGL